jgi:hypothetical protein
MVHTVNRHKSTDSYNAMYGATRCLFVVSVAVDAFFQRPNRLVIHPSEMQPYLALGGATRV